MKRASGALAAVLVAAGLFLLPCAAYGQDISSSPAPSGERIDRFSASIALEPDGDLQVAESITYDFGESERHGIFRDIPLKYDGGRESISVSDISVTDPEGTPYPFSVTTESSRERIQIGDPAALVSGT